MTNDKYLEKNISKNPAIELLEKMGYTYLSPHECNLQRGSNKQVLLKGILRNQLRELNRFEFGGVKQGFSSENIERAIDDLDVPLTEGLITANERIYDALMLGKSYQEIVGEGKILSFDLKYIDWDDFSNNVFHVTEEYKVESSDKGHNATPDIVLFVNGIPFAVIECKAPYISVEDGIEQMCRSERMDYIPQLFKFVQIVMSTNKNSVKYATVGTNKKYWSIWKEQDVDLIQNFKNKYITDRIPTVQDESILSLLSIKRLLELSRFFVVFDGNEKKICRYQQYFAIKEIIKTINCNDIDGNRKSGVIWHTQGSGKSLTMVMLAKYILLEMNKSNPRVVVVTDRTELDRQIAETFTHTKCKPARATSGKNLIKLIDEGRADVITTIINKFNTVESSGLKNYSRDIFVLVDESHRSNYGELATKMRVVFPNACYIGFTGTPLMKSEKNTMTKFGGLIHSYTIVDGVEDKAIVPLIYEGRFVEQDVDQENIDSWFEKTTKRLSDKQKLDLKHKWSSLKRLNSTEARIRRIALDINDHFVQSMKNTELKAMLATNSRRDAILYQRCFEMLGEVTTEVCISSPDMRENPDDIDESNNGIVLSYWDKTMKKYGNVDSYESSVKNRFLDGDIDILIVCNKLLTGFDAPRCHTLYIDRELREHNLLQAIARTNRLYDGKDYGLIVDYRGLIRNLNDALNMYSGAGLENFEPGDLKGTLTDIMKVAGDIRQSYSNLIELFASLKNKDDSEEVELFLGDEKTREEFYFRLCKFGKDLHIMFNSERVYDALKEDAIKYREAFLFYSKVRRSIKFRYGDVVDNKDYEPLMQNLLDTYMSVVGLKHITAPVDIMDKEGVEKELELMGSPRAKADLIHAKLTKSISERRSQNPIYYDSFSKRIKEVLEQYKERVITEAEYLKKMQEIKADYETEKTTIVYPGKIQNNPHAKAFYGVVRDVIDKNYNANSENNIIDDGYNYYNTHNAMIDCVLKEDDGYKNNSTSLQDIIADISIEITDIIEKHSRVDWTNNTTVHKKIEQDIDDMFYEYECEGKLKLSFEVIDKIIDNVKNTALGRFKV